MATPLVGVSGTYGLEYSRLATGMEGVGAVVPKSVTPNRQDGNPVPRIAEIRGGLLNAIGLQNAGVEAFIREELPKYRNLGVPVIASVAGKTVEDYVHCSRLLVECEEVAGIELNVSCPNVSKGGLTFGCDPVGLRPLVHKVRRAIGDRATLIVKLTPNVTDIACPAAAAIEGGASALALINTLRGMAIDIHTRKPKLGNKTGGVSGAVIHPVAVYMVARCYETCCREHGIPILGMGGVYGWEDAIELMLAGATAVGIGTALFKNPRVFADVAGGMRQYLADNGFNDVSEIVGIAIRGPGETQGRKKKSRKVPQQACCDD
jgi:dihydroorotate dehydrogenase (NAD+) catalytic subunit